MPKLNSPAVRTALKTVPRWKRQRAMIVREFRFKDFLAAMKFVNAVAHAAERAGHHPDIDIRWNRVTLALTTHDEGGLTDKDFTLAARCDRMAGRSAK